MEVGSAETCDDREFVGERSVILIWLYLLQPTSPWLLWCNDGIGFLLWLLLQLESKLSHQSPIYIICAPFVLGERISWTASETVLRHVGIFLKNDRSGERCLI